MRTSVQRKAVSAGYLFSDSVLNSAAHSISDYPGFRRNKIARAVVLSGFLIFAGFSPLAGADTQVGGQLPPPPDQLYGDLFVAVQTAQIYPDQKTFVDALPNGDPATIVLLYDAHKNDKGFSLAAFVNQYFTPPSEPVI